MKVSFPVILIGYMASGKTTVGKVLAQKLGCSFKDLDQIIEKKDGRTIPDIFQESGEAYFRFLERAALREAVNDKDGVISMGGGTPVNDVNCAMLAHSHALVVYLKASEEVILERLGDTSSRPMLASAHTEEEKKDRIASMLAQRKPYYEKAASKILDVDGSTPGQAADAIMEMMEQKQKEENTMRTDKPKILIMNGPNLNFLGIREPAIYGTKNYDALVEYLRQKGEEIGVETIFYQSNHEGALVDRIQQAYFEKIDGVVFNPGAYTHYSIALRDAIASVDIPFAEVHISDIQARESFRHESVLKDVCYCQIAGLGFDSYVEGMKRIVAYLQKTVEISRKIK